MYETRSIETQLCAQVIYSWKDPLEASVGTLNMSSQPSTVRAASYRLPLQGGFINIVERLEFNQYLEDVRINSRS
jgi:hypothetical protein